MLIIGEVFSIKINITVDNKKAIINELKIMQEMEDNNLLNNSLLSYAKIYSRKLEFDIFSKK